MALSLEVFRENLPNESTYRQSSSSDPWCENILIEEDGDYVIHDEQQLPFKSKKVLGRGYSAVVEKVQHRRTKEIFARKTIKFPRGRLKAQAEDRYQNEVDIIRSLKTHHHVIRLFATYTTKREGCLLLQPAADEGDLQDYLDNYADALDVTPQHAELKNMTEVLEQAFGCLSSALAYMHENGIRHKDIKPQNILIHRGRVIYTDFGASKDTRKDGESTTEGLPDFLTRKYSPPEVLEHDKRNFAADVYSLGCVFIEMLCAISCSMDHNQEHGENFSHMMDGIHAKLLSEDIPPRLSFLAGTIVQMTMRDPASRPDSDSVAIDISGHEGFSCPSCHSSSRETALHWSDQHQRWYWMRYSQTTGQLTLIRYSVGSILTRISSMGFLELGRRTQLHRNTYVQPPGPHGSGFLQHIQPGANDTFRNARPMYVNFC
jgi:serine/threonine protein kinase